MRRSLTFKERYLRMTKRHKEKLLPHSLIALGAFGAIIAGSEIWGAPADKPVSANQEDDEERYQLSMLGDIMLGRHVMDTAPHHDGGYHAFFRNTKDKLAEADYVTANFAQPMLPINDPEFLDDTEGAGFIENPEVLINNEDLLDGDEAFTSGEQFLEALTHEDATDAFTSEAIQRGGNIIHDKDIQLFTEPASAEPLADIGFTNVSLANNHMLNFGNISANYTLNTLEDNNIDTVGLGVGAEAAEPHVHTVGNNYEIATLSVTETYAAQTFAQAGILGVSAWYEGDAPGIIPAIQEASDKYDFTVVHFHWGTDFLSNPPDETEERFAILADAGADVIIGHNPSVLSPVEVIDETLVLTSMGNFISDQGWTRARDSAIADLHVTEADDGLEIDEVIFTPLRLSEFTPHGIENPIEQMQQARIFRQLSKNLDAEWETHDGRLHLDPEIEAES
ncbi:poly-gamma-glutamate synthesis protein (capsule biosynthesis protein) [Salsuginibacillus halophilus]|uniref:Poly-gamma-glutamate synthesis protein (Capsule biosynthesis protein) n=1 Tax=Salsuginibacillus halophilus TaxID=517424 RepID=A0A2P8H903_9BACI|nr:CapA family protein [Salsuginibacillus halophilus]PSL42716.1 poly-gamma-glutamate synthesis protein (capsule biosynthesis protein) [Salsuginibacillus halophilus]